MTAKPRLVLDRPVLTIDAQRGFGRVCIGGTTITAEAVAGMVAGGDSVAAIASDYGIDRDEVLLACTWMAWEWSKAVGRQPKWKRRVAAAWDEWSVETLSILGGHTSGPLLDPPEVD